MEYNVINTLLDTQRVTSSYADIYFDDDHCNYVRKSTGEATPETDEDSVDSKEWKSPSDALIGIVELKPPFTSKITRGKTHQGILAIGDSVIETQREHFLKYMNGLLQDNDAAWYRILEQEKDIVRHKVKAIYKRIFAEKSKVMREDIADFLKNSLQDLEDHMRDELYELITSAHANLISDFNTEIRVKLREEKNILKEVLEKKYQSEKEKVKHYYKLLFNDELNKHNKLINSVVTDRNDALKVFYRQLDAEATTAAMYIMSMERKKCRIKRFILEGHQDTKIKEKLIKIKEDQSILDAFQKQTIPVSEINREWEAKIRKILRLFLKFISFSLKLLPEQSTFLLDLEKMFVLQLNEMQKKPFNPPSVLVDADAYNNIFKFEQSNVPKTECLGEPFVVEGDPSDPPPIVYGSRETIPSDADLPFIRLQRKFVYAKCHGYEDIKKALEDQRCKCQDIPSKTPSTSNTSEKSSPTVEPTQVSDSVSLLETLMVDDHERLNACPGRKCNHWAKKVTFPYLDAYLNYSEEKYKIVKTLLGSIDKARPQPELLKPRDLAYRDLPFSVTTEPTHNVETQYSSQETLYQADMGCTCVEPVAAKRSESHYRLSDPCLKMKRKQSIDQMIREHPHLLNMLTDERYNIYL